MPSIWFIECDLYDSRRHQTASANSLPIQREIYVQNNNSKQGHHQRKVIVPSHIWIIYKINLILILTMSLAGWTSYK